MTKIIIAEDDLVIREDLSLLLANEGYRTTVVTDFTNVAQQVSELSPDLILLDLGLPNGDGTALCAEIRRASRTPIIFVTSRDSANDELLAHQVLEELGIDFFVVPQPTHDRTKAEFKRDIFAYDEKQDVYRCPNGKELCPKRLYRSGSGLFWEYWADKKDCGSCPLRAKCLNETDIGPGPGNCRTVISSLLFSAIFSRRWEPEYQEALKQCQIWYEGTFAVQKWGHKAVPA